MSQQMRRALAVVGLAAALLLSLPAPSRAAGFQDPAFAGGLVERIWTWLWSLAPSVPQGSTPGVMQQKDGPPSPPPGAPTSPSDDQGSMIDPDGK